MLMIDRDLRSNYEGLKFIVSMKLFLPMQIPFLVHCTYLAAVLKLAY